MARLFFFEYSSTVVAEQINVDLTPRMSPVSSGEMINCPSSDTTSGLLIHHSSIYILYVIHSIFNLHHFF